VGVFVFLISQSVFAVTPTYTISELVLPTGYSLSSGSGIGRDITINSTGQIASCATFKSSLRPVTWSDGNMTDLEIPSGFYAGRTQAINSYGQVVGNYSSSSNADRAFLYSNGSMQLLSPLTDSYGSAAYGVNDKGQIIGISTSTEGYYRATLWENAVPIDLGALSGPSSAVYSINNDGDIAGYSFNSLNYPRACLWHQGSIHDLGVLPGHIASGAYGINDNGQIVGSSRTDRALLGSGHAVLWSDGEIIDLGLLPGCSLYSIAFDINSSSQVVGAARNNYASREQAFIWNNGTMSNLNDLIPLGSGWVLNSAQSINDSGQIVGLGTLNGKNCQFLLSPVPEPSTILLFGVGIAGFFAWIRRWN
jgi:probable HAF family extracellular repeat protein